MPTEAIFASLEEAGYRREDIKHLDRYYVVKVLQHPRNPETGRLLIDPPEEQKIDKVREIREKLRRVNYPEHLIDEKVDQILKARAVAEAKKLEKFFKK